MLRQLARAVVPVTLTLITACDGGPTAPTDAERAASIPWEKLTGKIAYSAQCGGGAYCIHVIDVPTRTVRLIRRLEGNSIVSDLAWSADGTSVLYSDFVFFTASNAPPAYFRVASVSVATGLRSTVVSLGSHPAVANDGRIAYVRSGTGGRDICVVGGDCTPKWEFEFTRPAWSPDGSTIAFAMYAPGGVGIYTTTPGVVSLGMMLAGEGSLSGTAYGNPAYSPDGSRIAFDRFGSTVAASEIWTAAVDGTERHRIVGATLMTGGHGAAWSRDGSHLIYVGGDGGQSALRQVSNDGTQDIVVLRSVDYITGLAWIP